MNSWDRFILIVWRFTIGPVLFCLLLLCGIAGFFLGGPRFFSGCWKMAMYGMMADWNSCIFDCRDVSGLYVSGDYCNVERTNFISFLLWTLLFGLWIRMLLVALMFVTHLLLFSDWLAEAMLKLADCARNPAYVRDYWTRNWKMDDDGRLHKKNKVFHPYEISRRSDLSKLDGGNWERLLRIRPQFADKCDWLKLSGRDWTGLLNSQPQFADKCDWTKLDGENWPELLEKQPQFADKCDKWDEMDGENWRYLLEKQPQFADKCNKWDEMDGWDWANLLASQPQFADKCDWLKLSGRDWAGLLNSQPKFADKCDWSKLGGGNWAYLLASQPQFADMCDWSKLDGGNWAGLLNSQPKFADKCDWLKLSDEDWANLLEAQPQFAKYRPAK